MMIVKRYPNRKLYNTESKQYITLEGIAELIRAGDEVQILDHVTGEDLTAVTLTQIIFEQEKKQSGFLPRSVLTGLVQAGGETLGSLRRTLASPLDLFHQVDQEIANMDPAEAIEYLERKYVEIEYLYGSNIKIRESDVYKIEPIIIEKMNGDYLEEFGKMIMRLYPDSPLGDYYIGLYYETGYDYKRALKHYKNGYAKIGSDNPNADAYYSNIERALEKQRLEKLGLQTGEEPVEEESIEEEPAATDTGSSEQ